ncbi:hypothetical protein [Actinomycetospora lemnae]|uniref:Uncharacterized protein n=1 Tax=Actinomycetospora lemnae TaxID=3019891 RepID=A0ABT5SZ47_9PSEU|nr:hypothetical protein [Actinomycetospora sp. DW7H6]MDD7967986.1 hypothetical protein [Actinomycetospora sp. DW7H6]
MTTLLWVPVVLPPALMVLALLLDVLDRRLPPGQGGVGAPLPPAVGDGRRQGRTEPREIVDVSAA